MTFANSTIVAGSSRFRCWAVFESVTWWSTSRINDFLCSGDSCRRLATLCEECARFGVWTRPDRATGVVQKQSQVENERVFQIFEQMTIRDQLRIRRVNQGIEFIDTEQGVLVGSVAMEEFVLHQTSQLTEFGNVAAKEVDPMH